MRQRFIQSFSTSGTEHEAIDNELLGKPYVAFIEDGQYIDWNTKEKRGILKVTYLVDSSGAVELYYNRDGFSAIYFEDGTEYTGGERAENLNPNSEVTFTYVLADKTIAGAGGAFWNLHQVRSVVIPDGVETIPTNYLNFVDNLTAVTLPSTLKRIEETAFSRASKNESGLTLSELCIPSSVTYVGRQAFGDNKNLGCLVFEGTTPPVAGYYIMGLTSPTTCPIYVPDSAVNAYKTADGWSRYESQIKPISEKPQ